MVKRSGLAGEIGTCWCAAASVAAGLAVSGVARGLGTFTGSYLATISANSAAISGVIAVAPKLATVAPYAAQLTALSKIPPSVLAYLKAHAAAVQKAAAQAPGQWKSWDLNPHALLGTSISS